MMKKLQALSDPALHRRRKSVMLQVLDPPPRLNPARPPSGFGVRPTGARPTVSVKEDSVDHADLMRRVAQDADQQAFAALFAHFGPRIKAFLMKSGAGAAQAEDCAQDVMATVWRKAAMFDPTRASVATWVFTIARNRRIDLLRREARPDPEDLFWGPEPEADPADALVLQQDTNRLGAALALLPQTQRELIERAYFGDLSHGEIARITGLPLGTIKSRIRLALEKLRQAMN